MRKTSLFIITAFLALLAACSGGGKYDAFAQCLTDNDATFYGAYWCPHCAAQKELLGNSMEFITYVECSLPNKAGQTVVCQKANITSYPTWEFADGERVTGVMQLADLAEKTGCEIYPQ